MLDLGYGGKGSRQLPCAAAAALGAFVTGKQVHVQLERLQDMQMTGGREDLYAEYEIGVNAEGARFHFATLVLRLV